MALPEFPATTTSVDELVGLRAAAIAQLRGSQRRVRQRKIGMSSSNMLGRGLDFAEVRAYQAGDDVRNMDWNVTARTGIAHTKLFVEERELPCFLMVDMRSSMSFATRGVFKSMQAARLAALLGWCAVASNDRVGGIVFGDNWHHEVKPRSGRSGLMQLIRHIAQASGDSPVSAASAVATGTVTPAATDNDEQAGSQLPEHLLLENLKRLRHMVRAGGDVFVLSDFAGLLPNAGRAIAPELTRVDTEAGTQTEPTSAAIDMLKALAHTAHLTLLHISDPIEVALPEPGDYLVRSRGLRKILSTSAAKTRERHARRFQQRAEILSKVAGRNAACAVSTRERPVDVLNAMLNRTTVSTDQFTTENDTGITSARAGGVGQGV